MTPRCRWVSTPWEGQLWVQLPPDGRNGPSDPTTQWQAGNVGLHLDGNADAMHKGRAWDGAQVGPRIQKRLCFLQADHRQQIMPCICVKLDTKLPIHLLSWVALLCEENCWTLHQLFLWFACSLRCHWKFFYPLVNIHIAMENSHRNSGFSH